MAKTYRDIPSLTSQQIANFWNKVDKTPGHGPNGDCWIWTGGKGRHGYGHFNMKSQKRQCQAHRVAYALTYPSFNPSLNVCHSCDFGHGGCVRPDHLWQGSQADNLRDMHKKGRSAKMDERWTKTHSEALHRGNQCSWAKLTDDQVREIRKYAALGASHTALAQEYKVGRPMITMIVNGKRWKHVK